MRPTFPFAFAVFVAGGLLTGMLGLKNLVAHDPAPRSASNSTESTSAPTPVPTLPPPPRVASGVTPARVVSAATRQPASADNSWWFLYVIDGNLWEAGGGTTLQLTEGAQVSQPALRDDGLALISRALNGSDVLFASPNAPLQPITHDTSPIVDQNHWASQPVFVPGTDRLYVSADFDKDSTGPGSLAIWELSLQQESAVQITTPPEYAGGDQDVTVNPDDAHQIIFTRYAYDNSQLTEQVSWMDIASDRVVGLTPANHPSRQASFSPDGKSVAFIQAGAGLDQDLYVGHLDVSSDGAELQDVQQVASGMIANPTWTPDGSSLVYVALNRDQFQLWTRDIRQDGSGAHPSGQPRQVTDGPGIDATSRPVVMTREQAANVRTWLGLPSAQP